VRSKDEDKQNLVDVKVHQIVPSKPKAPPPPPPTVKIKTTPTSPTNQSNTVGVDNVDKPQTNTTPSVTKAPKARPHKVAKPKKMPAPPPPSVHKAKPKEVTESVELSPQEHEDLLVDVTPGQDNSSEYSIATTTNLDSPTKSFCSIDDIPKTGFDFLDNW
jgi:hypothetical protein